MQTPFAEDYAHLTANNAHFEPRNETTRRLFKNAVSFADITRVLELARKHGVLSRFFTLHEDATGLDDAAWIDLIIATWCKENGHIFNAALQPMVDADFFTPMLATPDWLYARIFNTDRVRIRTHNDTYYLFAATNEYTSIRTGIRALNQASRHFVELPWLSGLA
jgi:hypothetical protein